MKKIIPDAVMDEAACLQMLSSVDYDMDRRPEFKYAFEHSLGVAKMCLLSPENGMRGLALAALLSYDIQQLVRMQHERWIREQHGAFSFGDIEMSPEECIRLASASAVVVSQADTFRRERPGPGLLTMSVRDTTSNEIERTFKAITGTRHVRGSFITRFQAEFSFDPAPVTADEIIVEASTGHGARHRQARAARR
ncbi:hypothetical protein D7B24_008101 [Verticillium nonalfalfae]|uniref:HD domain-containing protein n=1 Tax=Verticillium nonalfalfae TaxID=1051616 RepID=A0A3M9YMZ1_9PEZI|nr:uncharacterized protein D7B24_008101 [Verticillium nonalfalfae]RNJ60410.1 hypothetical protein D7B24_008101 [Verticillium nonalfalfae]